MSDERLPDLHPSTLNDLQHDAVRRLIASRRGTMRGPFQTLLYSPELLNRSQALGEFLRYQSSLPADLRELAILVTARQWNQQYEWAIHTPHAEVAGLSPEILASIGVGNPSSLFTEVQLLVYEFCVTLHVQHAISDTLYLAVVRALGESGTVELCALCGYYTMLAMVMNVARTKAPPGEPLPFAPPEESVLHQFQVEAGTKGVNNIDLKKEH